MTTKEFCKLMNEYKTCGECVGVTAREFAEKHGTIDYCEVIITPSGLVFEARPSHIEWQINKIISITGVSREFLYDAMPESESPIDWMCDFTGCIAVWFDTSMVPSMDKLTDEQAEAISILKTATGTLGQNILSYEHRTVEASPWRSTEETKHIMGKYNEAIRRALLDNIVY
jgi:hypothetical protein